MMERLLGLFVTFKLQLHSSLYLIFVETFSGWKDIQIKIFQISHFLPYLENLQIKFLIENIVYVAHPLGENYTPSEEAVMIL